MTVVLARVTGDPLDGDEVERAVRTGHDGAVVVFRGVIRDHDGGQPVTRLDYSAHPQAEAFLRAACDRVATDSGLRVAAVHRVGSLGIGEVALVAAVAAPHRAEAFAACAALVDAIKRDVPIWKRQHAPDGTSAWVGL